MMGMKKSPRRSTQPRSALLATLPPPATTGRLLFREHMRAPPRRQAQRLRTATTSLFKSSLPRLLWRTCQLQSPRSTLLPSSLKLTLLRPKSRRPPNRCSRFPRIRRCRVWSRLSRQTHHPSRELASTAVSTIQQPTFSTFPALQKRRPKLLRSQVRVINLHSQDRKDYHAVANRVGPRVVVRAGLPYRWCSYTPPLRGRCCPPASFAPRSDAAAGDISARSLCRVLVCLCNHRLHSTRSRPSLESDTTRKACAVRGPQH
jgi:hypothetical protein